MTSCRKDFHETKYMSFLLKDHELLKNTIQIGKKLRIVSKSF